jgi:hypothetical protein
MRIQLRADALLFMPAPENVPQFAGEVLGRFARGRPSPHHAEVNLLIDAVPLRPPIDEARPRRRADKIVERSSGPETSSRLKIKQARRHTRQHSPQP